MVRVVRVVLGLEVGDEGREPAVAAGGEHVVDKLDDALVVGRVVVADLVLLFRREVVDDKLAQHHQVAHRGLRLEAVEGVDDLAVLVGEGRVLLDGERRERLDGHGRRVGLRTARRERAARVARARDVSATAASESGLRRAGGLERRACGPMAPLAWLARTAP